MHHIVRPFSSRILLKLFSLPLCSINWDSILLRRCAQALLMALAALAAGIKVLLHHHSSSFLVLGSSFSSLMVKDLGTDILKLLGCPSLRRCLVHPAVVLLNHQVKICLYCLI
jgi:hypothetical protein